MARFPSGKKYIHQYGNLLVTVFSEHGVYYANVKDESGYEVGLETPEQSILQAARYALSVLANPGENPHPELLAASKVLGEEAYQAILDVEGGGPEMAGSGRYQADCSFKCPAKGDLNFAIWPRKGETANDACMRGLRDRVDPPQVEHCVKIRARYIE